MTKLAEIYESINAIRSNLNQIIDEDSSLDEAEVIEKSKEIDVILNEYMELLKKNNSKK